MGEEAAGGGAGAAESGFATEGAVSAEVSVVVWVHGQGGALGLGRGKKLLVNYLEEDLRRQLGAAQGQHGWKRLVRRLLTSRSAVLRSC